jgi:phosphate uptake regulator
MSESEKPADQIPPSLSFHECVRREFIGDNATRIVEIGINASIAANLVPAFLLRGPAGSGKTYFTAVVAKCLNAGYVFIQTTLNSSEDELLYKYIPSERTRSGIAIKYGPLPEALIKSKKKRVVLVIDEFDKTRPSADALLLDFLQNARVSVRIDDTNEVIVGNPRNLVVFLTSNDFRDFSDPLMRRVITIFFTVLDPAKVREFLLRKFHDDEMLVDFLVHIYEQSLSLNLRKPITIQELYQLGYALKMYPDANIYELIKSFIAKDLRDLDKIYNSIYRHVNNFIENRKTSTAAYSPAQTFQTSIENIEKTTDHNEITLTENATEVSPSIEVTAPKVEPINPDTVKKDTEITSFARIEDDNFNAYTNLVTMQKRAVLTDRPDILGIFKVVLDEATNKLTITSNKPLTVDEAATLLKAGNGEAYAEEHIVCISSENCIRDVATMFINNLKPINNTIAIVYATDKTIIIASNDKSIIIRLDRIDTDLLKMSMYLSNKSNKMNYVLDKLTSEDYHLFDSNNFIRVEKLDIRTEHYLAKVEEQYIKLTLRHDMAVTKTLAKVVKILSTAKNIANVKFIRKVETGIRFNMRVYYDHNNEIVVESPFEVSDADKFVSFFDPIIKEVMKTKYEYEVKILPDLRLLDGVSE